ncbi:MAG: hypothetical protein KKG14_02625 [Alphaproteobacteria bacterium]|nr:hypothetical protein [Alphaproteobacteria bacterium]MBU2271702.1 hypothetical protein [Alphaproteobacteria bacterium]MBU2417579.1 hypothetical protein [Alphaproteobacteria bacterium]
MRILIFLLLLGFSASARAEARQESVSNPPRISPFQAAQWRDPDLGRSIRKGFANAEAIWLLGESGQVVRFDRRSGERLVLAGSVADILPEGNRLWALASNEAQGETLRDLRAEEPTPLEVNAIGEAIGLFPAGAARPGILTTRTVLLPSAEGDWTRTRLAAVLDGANVTTSDGAGGVYIGLNRGEWGGGLRRVDATTGSIAFVTEPSEELCGGLINPECDPVVGAFPDPDHQGCILTGVGLAHLFSRKGAILRVCGSEITPVFSAPIPQSEGEFPTPGDWPLYSLVQTRDGWIAISDERYFQMRAGEVVEYPVPSLRDWSGLRLGEASDGALFVMSACCWGAASNPTRFSVLAIPDLNNITAPAGAR